MVVTGSRLEAVRYKQSFDHYIKQAGVSDQNAGRVFRYRDGRYDQGENL